jgi:hypothetical protein
MKASLVSPFALALTIAAALPVLSFAQASGTGAATGTRGATTGGAAGTTGSVGGSAGASSNPLIGGTGTYGTAAQGSVDGGGAYSVPTGADALATEAFRRLDRNGDGVLSIEEFRAGYATRPVGAGNGSGAAKKKSR